MDERRIAADDILRRAVIENHNREMAKLPTNSELAKIYPERNAKESFQDKLEAMLRDNAL